MKKSFWTENIFQARIVGMKSIEIPTQNGYCDATIAFPPQADPSKTYPGVLMLMDAPGPRQNLFGMIQKLASHGYIVLLPNLFFVRNARHL